MTSYSKQFAIISVILMGVTERGDRGNSFRIHLHLSASVPHTVTILLELFNNAVSLTQVIQTTNNKPPLVGEVSANFSV
jgi:hypothetical protein